MASNTIDKASALFAAGQHQQGLGLLAEAARQGDADALEQLAAMAISGEVVHRDLALARDLYGRAAQAGSGTAARTYYSFLANGTGGPADWPAALQLMDALASADPDIAIEREIIAAMSLTGDGTSSTRLKREIISQSPHATVFRDFLTHAECDFLIDRSKPALQPSLVVDPATGRQVENPVRTSDAVGYPLVTESPAIFAICNRIALASDTYVKQGEPLQVLRYAPGQEYRPHFDAIDKAENQRILTFLVYLNDDYEGGETVFPTSGLAFKGRKGDGFLFRNSLPSGAVDPASHHAGTPVTAGEKFLASRWIRERNFTPE